jgi:hypothetical protein
MFQRKDRLAAALLVPFDSQGAEVHVESFVEGSQVLLIGTHRTNTHGPRRSAGR